MTFIGNEHAPLSGRSALPQRASKLLTVFIPSYNRADELDRCLNSVFKAIDVTAFRDQIDVLVVDDYSSEPVERVIQAHRSLNRTLRYLVHDTKCGVAEIAMLNCIKHVDTRFAWCLGNDDYVIEGAFDNLIPVLHQSKSSFFLLNFVGEARDGTRYEYFRSNETEIVFETGRQFFLNFGFVSSTTTFPCLCFDVDCLRDRDLSQLTDASPIYSHTALFASAFHNRPCSFLPKPLVIFNHNEAANERHKLVHRNFVFGRPAFFHSSVGLARHLLAISQQTGIPLQQLAAAHEDEIDKDSKRIKRSISACFIFNFAIEQFMHELDVFHPAGDVPNKLCFAREDIELLDAFFECANFRELSGRWQQAKGVFCNSRLAPDQKKEHLSSLTKPALGWESQLLTEIAPLAKVPHAIYYGDGSGPKLLYDDAQIFERRAA